jgi:hypothetical protein
LPFRLRSLPGAEDGDKHRNVSWPFAHAQLIAIYWALRNGTPYLQQVQRLQEDRREAQIRHHLQRLSKLGYEHNKIG